MMNNADAPSAAPGAAAHTLPTLLEELHTGADAQREIALARLAPVIEAACLTPIVAIMEDPTESPAGRLSAATLLGHLVGRVLRALPALVTLLADPDPQVRTRVLHLLSEFNHPALFAYAVPLLNDSHADVRQAALGVLEDLRDPRATPYALDRLLHDPDPGVRFCAAGALLQAGDARALPALEYVAAHDPALAANGVDRVSTLAQEAIAAISDRAAPARNPGQG